MMHHKKAILFDLDGTLVDSVPDLTAAINAMLQELGREAFEEETVRSWVGNGAAVLVKRALSGSGEVDADLDEALAKKAHELFLEHYSTRLSLASQPYAGVVSTLEILRSRGYRLAVVTNKPYRFIQPLLEGLEMYHFFELCIGGDTVGQKKPDPLPLLHACEQLGLTPDACLMVGDSRNDILAANAAGMQSIGVTYGYNYGEDIRVYGPTEVVESFGDILEFFEQIS